MLQQVYLTDGSNALAIKAASAPAATTDPAAVVALSPNSPATAIGYQIVTNTSFTRPANTTAYAANGVVANSTTAATVLTFTGAGRANGRSGIILSARHIKQSTTTSGATYRLYLYTVSPTAINDASQFTLLYSTRTSQIGYIDLNHVGGGTGSDSTLGLTPFTNLPFTCDAASSSLFGILTVTQAYTPASAEQHFIELTIAQN
jgi:hypothetical protein